jgi:hypothetical protein
MLFYNDIKNLKDNSVRWDGLIYIANSYQKILNAAISRNAIAIKSFVSLSISLPYVSTRENPTSYNDMIKKMLESNVFTSINVLF